MIEVRRPRLCWFIPRSASTAMQLRSPPVRRVGDGGKASDDLLEDALAIRRTAAHYHIHVLVNYETPGTRATAPRMTSCSRAAWAPSAGL